MHSRQAPLPADNKSPFTYSGKMFNCPSTGTFTPGRVCCLRDKHPSRQATTARACAGLEWQHNHLLCNSSSVTVLGLQACKACSWPWSKGTDYGWLQQARGQVAGFLGPKHINHSRELSAQCVSSPLPLAAASVNSQKGTVFSAGMQ